jgi:hypothetical protein
MTLTPTRRMAPRTAALAAACAAGLLAAVPAAASCGAAFCTLMTDRFAQGGAAPDGWSTDLRLETLTQDRLRSGSRDVDPASVHGEEAIERRTRNTGLQFGLGRGLGDGWSLMLRVPLLARDHLHDLVDDATGAVAGSERWRFTRLGDAQATVRREFAAVDGGVSYAVFGGLKLPTGGTQVRNDDGVRAERALQPGSGTTDAVLGAALRWPVGLVDAWFGQASLVQSLNAHEGYRPGRRAELSAGWSHALTHRFGTVLQLNLRRRGRDAGAQAEPENSGSTTLDLSPGLTWGVGPASTLYAYWQHPLVQKVNGLQLVPRQAFAVGWTADF